MMRLTAILILFPIVSLSQVKQHIEEFSRSFKVTDEQALLSSKGILLWMDEDRCIRDSYCSATDTRIANNNFSVTDKFCTDDPASQNLVALHLHLVQIPHSVKRNKNPSLSVQSVSSVCLPRPMLATDTRICTREPWFNPCIRGYYDISDLLAQCNEEEASIDRNEWETYLRNNLVLDDLSMDTIPAGTYTVFVRLVIDKKGSINDVSVLKDPGYGLGQRVKRALQQYTGRWQPAKLNGHTIISRRIQPVTFIVEEAEECIPAELIL